MTRPLLIFGLRGTLLERLSIQETTNAIPRRPSFTFSKYNVWLRPGIVHTLEVLSESVDLAIWSATPHRNTAPLVSMAFSHINFKFVWHREQTSPDAIKRLLPAESTQNQFAVKKDLSSVYSHMPQYTPERTVIVDDTVFKSRRHSGNVILVPTYDIHRIMKEDNNNFDKGSDVQGFINFIQDKILCTSDVRAELPRKVFW